MDLEGCAIVIISGEGSGPGTIERYEGAKTAKALRNRLSRERCHGDRWADAWVCLAVEPDPVAGVSMWGTYYQLGRDMETIGEARQINPATIRVNPAAVLAAGHKRPASAANGRLGGRPSTNHALSK